MAGVSKRILTLFILKFMWNQLSLAENNNTSSILAPFRSIPLRLVYLMYPEGQLPTHYGGIYPLRDILVERINAHPTLLRSYKVAIDLYNTNFSVERNVAKSIRLFAQHLASDCPACACDMRNQLTQQNFSSAASATFLSTTRTHHTAPLFFGPEYSAEARIIAQLAPLYNLVEICSGTVASDLSDRVKYPNFFRTIGTTEGFVKLPRALAQFFNFSSVALLERDEAYAEPMQRVDYDLTTHNISVLFHLKFRISKTSNDSTDQVLENIKLYDARIIFFWSNEGDEQRIFCRSLDHWSNSTIGNTTIPAFNSQKFLVIWLDLSQVAPGLDPRVPRVFPNCPASTLSTMLNGTLVARILLWSLPDEKLDFDDDDNQHFFAKIEALGRSRYNYPTGEFSPIIPRNADTMWLGFVALDALDRRLQAETPSRSLLDFTVQSSDIAKMLKEEMLKVRFRGTGGEFKFDAKGEVDASIYIDQYRPDIPDLDYPYVRILKFEPQLARVTPLNQKTIFGTADGRPPPDKKSVSNVNESNTTLVTLLVTLLCALAAVAALTCTIAYRMYKRRAMLQFSQPIWLIDIGKLTVEQKGSRMSSSFVGISMTTVTNASHSFFNGRGRVALLNQQQPVTMQHLPAHASKFTIDVRSHKLLSAVHNSLQHDHLLQFIGYCCSTTLYAEKAIVFDQYLLWQHCEKGSLYELVHGGSLFNLDVLLEYAIMLDIASGMSFLHTTFVRAHGALCPSACLIDKRFSVKVADYADEELSEVFGLKTLMKIDSDEMLNFGTAGELVSYMAPEVARAWLQTHTKIKTASADVYAYAILLYELITRGSAYDTSEVLAEHILQQVAAVDAQPEKSTPPFRPSPLPSTADARLTALIRACWAEEVPERPTFRDNVRQLQQISGVQANSSVTDQLLKRLERYASDMESLVHERTEELVVEKRRSDALLEAMLPAEIASELKRSGHVQPESFDSVSVYFSDIVGFTTLSASSTPIEVVNFLNALYTLFDARIDLYDAYKVETIGDAYMVVSGLPRRNGNLHSAEIAKLSLALLDDIRTFRIPHRPDDKLQLRIGLHTGPCVAGVVGTKMPRYCLFGDTVNTASRMETNGLPSKVHISDAFASALHKFGIFSTEPRGVLEIKGKGEMSTFWLSETLNEGK